MSKTNIKFNNAEYQIDESVLAPATAELKSHLSTVMNGSGATINFGGTAYGVDSTKLSSATTEFVSHLDTIAGSGAKVVVGGVEYGIDSTKVSDAVSQLEVSFGGVGEERLEGDGAEYYTLAPTALSFRSDAPLNELQDVQINGVTVDPSNYTLEEGSTIVVFPIDYLKTLDVGNYEVDVVSESKSVKGGFTVVAPELNEYGFYYNQPYAASVQALGTDLVIIFRRNGLINVVDLINFTTEVCTYIMDGDTAAISCSLGELHCTFSDYGIYGIEIDTTFVLGLAGIVSDEEYLYVPSSSGYDICSVLDKNKTTYSPIRSGINNKPTIGIRSGCFSNITSLKEIIIPASIAEIATESFGSCTNLESVIFDKNSQLFMIGNHAFKNCSSLTRIEIPVSVTNISSYVFQGCTNLLNIAFEGTIVQWNTISKLYNWNDGCPATHVQCSDGTVEL